MITFLLGESRQLKFEVSNRANPAFVIASATYQIYKDNEVIENGDLEIDAHILVLTFTPEDRGYYWLELAYTIGPDTIKARYKIDVD